MWTASSAYPLWARKNPISVSSRAGYQQEFFPVEGAPDGLLFEPEIMTLTEEAAFLERDWRHCRLGRSARMASMQSGGSSVLASNYIQSGGNEIGGEFLP